MIFFFQQPVLVVNYSGKVKPPPPPSIKAENSWKGLFNLLQHKISQHECSPLTSIPTNIYIRGTGRTK